MRHIFVFLLIALSLKSFAQVSQPYRYEIEVSNLNESYFTASAEENGLFIFKQNLSKNSLKESIWDVIWLDTALQEVSRKELPIATKYTFKGSVYSNNHIVLLFQSGIDYAQDILFMSYKINEDNFTAYKYENLVPLYISHIEMKGEVLVYGGSLDDKTVVSLFNLSKQKGMILPGLYNKGSELVQININPDNDHIQIITSEEQRDQSFDIVIRYFSDIGRLLDTKQISAGTETNLMSAYVSQRQPNSNFIASTYSLDKPLGKSDGILIKDLKNEPTNQRINYNKFTDFEHFFNHMGSKSAERIENKIAKRKNRGKDLNMDFYVKIRDIQSKENHNILLAEEYKPRKKEYYRNDGYQNQFQKNEIVKTEVVRNNTNRDEYSRPINNFIAYGFTSIYRFDHLLPLNNPNDISGYDYLQAFIFGFNNNGKRLWDNSIEIDGLTSRQLKNFVYTASLDKQMVLLYLNNQHLHYKTIKEDVTVKDKTSEPLKLYNKTDVLNNSIYYFEGLKPWHDNNYYAYGVNSISNSKISVENERKVFFINKIVVE